MESQHEIQLNKPEPFNPNKNSTSTDWRIWKQNFLIYLELTDARLKLSKRGLALFFLNLIGPVGIEAKENMTFDDPTEEESMEVLFKKFDEIFDAPLNEIEERYKFFSRRKYETETIQNYVRCLKEQAAKCNFNKQTEKFILDMVVLSMDNNLQRRIFLAKDLSLDMAINLYIENLMKEDQMRNMYNSNFNSLHTDDLIDITKKADDYFSQNINKQENKSNNEISQQRICSKCGTNHPYQQCPAYDYTCFKCRSKGHYEHRCKNASVDSTKTDEQIKTTAEAKNKSTIKENEQKDLQQCLWCGLKHNQGQCQHNPNCTMCDKFPHNICFNCKKNPHELSCYYKSVITLPALPAKTLNLSSSAHNTSSRTENGNYNSNFDKLHTDYRVNTKDDASKNNCFQPKAKVCGKCSETGQGSEECKKVQNNINHRQSSKYRVDDKNQAKAANVCPECGTRHPTHECPARNKQNNTKRVCFRCNSQHPPKQCPAYNVTCYNCNKLGHFSKACKSKKIQEFSSNCPQCNMPLQPYNEVYDYCKYCNVLVSHEESSEDSTSSSESEIPQPRRRNRRRQRRNRQAKNEEGCCIS